MELGGLHPITGRQWRLTDEQSNALWPDACVVVPFGAQTADATGKVLNPAPGTSVQGGWTVTHTLETLELRDLVQNTTVAGVTAVWAAGPGGDTPALHVLGDNPFAWLTPHLDAAASATTTVFPLRDQWFGSGPAQLFGAPRRFGEVVIAPHAGHLAWLVAAPLPWLTTRMLRAPGAGLSFSYSSGWPIVVDELWLGILYRSREELHHKGWEIDSIVPLPGGWGLALLRIDVGAGVSGVTIPYGGSILWVRYRHRALTVTTPERITLQPGHYELTLSGTTKGKAPSGFSDAADVPWSATQRFWVEHPPSLRPYVHSSTFGDDRLFGPKPGFDPTLPGVGFPLHRDYLPVVRFCVPYVKGMFPALRLRADYPDAPDVVEDVSVAANAAGESSLPDAAVDWKTAHGGTVAPDDEVEMTSALTPGAASFRISHVPAAGPEFTLDSWGAHVSRFANAQAHVAWAGTCLTRWYRQDGPHERTACPTLAQPGWKHISDLPLHASVRAHDLHAFDLEERASPFEIVGSSLAGKLLHPPQWPVGQMPDEYDSPPDDWPLPSSLGQLAVSLDPGSSQRFLLFLWRSGVHLSGDAAAPALAGVGDPVGATVMEAVCDDADRPLALWLRTPEPLDWRRVEVEATLRHVEPGGDCPTGYANRHSMSISVELLPSPDGSSVLLVGKLAGIPTRLPRGEIALKITYDPTLAGLVHLRPRTPLPGGKEELTLTFLQPLGKPWPIKPPKGDGGFHVPHIPQLVEQVPHFGPPEPDPLEEIVQHLKGEGVGP